LSLGLITGLTAGVATPIGESLSAKITGEVKVKASTCPGSTLEGQAGKVSTMTLVRKHGTTCWRSMLSDLAPGTEVDVLINAENYSGRQVDDLTIQAYLPDDFSLVPGSTIFGNSVHPKGVSATDDITGTGINVGSYAPRANAWAIFTARTPASPSVSCGVSTWVLGGRVAHPSEDDVIGDWSTVGILDYIKC
jgi:hypothetical protein